MLDELNVLSLLDDDVEFLPIVSMEDEPEGGEFDTEKILPLLPLRNTVLFPGVVIPITVGRERSIKAVRKANSGDKFIGVLTQIDPSLEEPSGEDLSEIGTLARIMKMLKMPDGSTTVIIQGRERFKLESLSTEEPFFSGIISMLDIEATDEDQEFEAMMSTIKDFAEQIINLSPNIPTEAAVVLKNIDKSAFLLNFISSNLQITNQEKQALLELSELKERANWVLKHLHAELQLLELKNQIQSKVQTNIDKQQRDYFLHQQLKTIQSELGENTDESEISKLKARANLKQWPEVAAKKFNKEINRLKRLNPAIPDYSLSLNYVETLLDLPWQEVSIDKFDLKKATKVLDADHFGLEKVKKRILEHLAVLKLKGNMRAPILCLVGPPGVGKTSLGRSIATALDRQYIRMSLGGLNDESEIRGHRKTYIGAMPGRIIQSIRKAKVSNPVFILDEIDKIGNSFKGDPSSALLEVLDPEQNSSFYDNYLEVEYDLSKVMFIATANSLSAIHPALRDRMEVIQIEGYSLEEKLEIARRHLVKKQRVEHGLKANQIRLNKKVLQKVVSEYTRESGVRELERKIASIMRDTAKKVAMEEEYAVTIKATDIESILGLRRYDKDIYKNENPPGVVIGLAWTQVGGDILFIECSLYKGSGKLVLTGNLGDVMKESATTAMSYIRTHATKLGIEEKVFEQTDFHIHVPEGAIPKDGPSAGISMFTALSSALTQRKVKPFLAMTGEITLRGKVLPVGGIKEKILAANRAGLKEVMLSSFNRRNVEEINPNYIKKLRFHYIDNMMDAIQVALSS